MTHFCDNGKTRAYTCIKFTTCGCVIRGVVVAESKQGYYKSSDANRWVSRIAQPASGNLLAEDGKANEVTSSVDIGLVYD